ncbi:hypothetical protein D931_01718, partial [Enterococcus faecium 13.SD.W.09]
CCKSLSPYRRSQGSHEKQSVEKNRFKAAASVIYARCVFD